MSRPVYTGRGNWPETRQRRPGGPGWRLGAWPVRLLVLVAAVGGVLWFLLQAFEVKTIEVKASSGGEHIQQVAQGLVNGKWWWQRSLLTLDTGEQESALEQTDPMIKAVDVRRKWPHG
ncbi:MAG TPA: FtsQ-type POTRA domain-containing protein, partial [Candidatus Saccharimonas sp.]|nr:FtsQ-type POTRA domain-containing protein [Candidatus Saccharimonas sp.]